jgi:DNA adenine methylase Dam
MSQIFNKSPMNYIGGKYKMLDQIEKYFPKNINNFVDIFAGGLDVSINTEAKKTFCNDINIYVIQIYRAMQKLSTEELMKYVEQQIKTYNLSKIDKKAYEIFRSYYNKTKNPLDLYILMCFSFNYQIRFNSNHEYNNTFGSNRSWFNPTIKENLIKFNNKIKFFNFSADNFKNYDISKLKKGDFLYADPPYRITTGSYNDGKRGFEGWSLMDDLALFELLDKLDKQEIKFALSEVIEHKGKKNEELIIWKRKYKTHHISYNYDNCNYQANNKNNVTKEVLITNY